MNDRAVAITCQGVSKSFALVDGGNAWRVALGLDGKLPRFQALRNVSFDVPKGQFVGVLGRNGAGKSTLLRVIGGVYAADTGRISINGALSGLYELGLVGNAQLTGRKYADRLLNVHGFTVRRRAAMIADIHDFSELGDRFDDPVQTYSAGMSARLFFSTATAGSYEVYLLDEIMAVGDLHFQAKCWRRLRDRVSRGASGVLVTHDWSAIIRMCETAHVLEKGRVIFSGPAELAARRYLYGETARPTYHAGAAHFADRPATSIIGSAGEDLHVKAMIEIKAPLKVDCLAVIERLQPGYGWETSLMSRKPTPVGEEPGRYAIDILFPQLPLDPGLYQIGIQLVTTDREKGPPYIDVLDSWSWLNGNGLALEVSGDPTRGLALPLRWRVESPQTMPA
jgi:lipopolysaccharide transport system ATP-binding protein